MTSHTAPDQPSATHAPTLRDRAVTQRAYGTSEVLRLETLERPRPAPGEVLVRVHAAGLDRGTWHLMTGRPYLVRLAMGLRAPRDVVVGRDVAGTVVEVGEGVTRFAVGDEVYGAARGSLAEHAVVRQDRLAPKPAALSWEQAGVVPISGLTAIQAVEAARIGAGQQVLVLGASGGVGSYVVQLAVALGAEVTGVCSAGKADLVRALGATTVLDYRADDPADGQRHWDVVIDIGGNSSIRRLRRMLTPTGTAVLVGGEEGGRWTGGFGRSLRAAALSPFLRQRLVMLTSREDGRVLERLAPYLETGAVVPSVDSVHSLADASAAMRRLEAGEVRGKVAIAVA
jgi:NADPH:quinone reductase-like Zn-dependent oxidoreductase